jgi:putative flippase GtrA
MITFTKAQLAAVLATGVDFGITYLLLHFAGIPIVSAGATGTICGGTTNFLINRNWVFNAQEEKWAAQLNRYVLVWIGNLVLNVSGLWLLTHYTGLKDMFAKIITAVTVAVCYNYPLQKRFVFK